jgi:hypothetical protein
MKLKYYISIILTVITFITFFSCDKEEEVDYNYNFYDARWSGDYSDQDSDGYATSRLLRCFLNLEEDVTRNVYAKVYYRTDTVSEYVYYSDTREYEFKGIESPLIMEIALGALEKELYVGSYNFLIEVYEVGSERLEAEISDKDTSVLGNIKFEKLKDDQNVSLSAKWTEQEDLNADGYNSYSKLIFDANLDVGISKDYEAMLYYRLVDETDYTLFEKSEMFTVTGSNPNDSIEFNIGRKPDELPMGEYTFRIALYEYGSFFPVAYLEPEEATVLQNLMFQTKDEDSYFYEIKSAVWGTGTDNDADGYYQIRNLIIDVNVDKDVNRVVFANIYIKHRDSTNFMCYDSTIVFTINGASANDIFTKEISSNKLIIYQAAQNDMDTTIIDSAKYSFMIDIYENVPYQDRTVKASFSGEILNLQNFENIIFD